MGQDNGSRQAPRSYFKILKLEVCFCGLTFQRSVSFSETFMEKMTVFPFVLWVEFLGLEGACALFLGAATNSWAGWDTAAPSSADFSAFCVSASLNIKTLVARNL